jgi:hypothetical protein
MTDPNATAFVPTGIKPATVFVAGVDDRHVVGNSARRSRLEGPRGCGSQSGGEASVGAQRLVEKVAQATAHALRACPPTPAHVY